VNKTVFEVDFISGLKETVDPAERDPQEATETNASQLENRKQTNMISRIHRGSVRGRL
jgi:hypothetical protein